MSEDISDLRDALSDALGKLGRIEQELAEVKEIVRRHDKGAYLDYGLISNYHLHGDMPSKERWDKIRAFENAVRGLKEFHSFEDVVMVKVLGRLWMLFSGSDGYVAKHIMAHGYWELSSTELIATEVQPGMRVVDAGANIGYYSVLMGDKVGPNGFMYVFEPTPKLIKNLNDTLFLNGLHGRYRLITDPLWSITGESVRFAIPVEDTKNASILADDNKENEFVELRTITLDDAIPAGQAIDFMKIDVEGAEQKMWDGMGRVLRDSPSIKIFLEFNAGRDRAAGDLVDKMKRDGFKLAYLDPLMGKVSINKDRLLTENFGEDWMLILER